MVDVTETFPGTIPAINQKADLTAVPVGQEDNWWDAGDSNRVAQIVAVERAIRLYAKIAALSEATTAIDGKAFKFTGLDGTSGLGTITTSLAAELNRLWAAAIEKIEQGGDLDGTISNTAFMGVGTGIVSAASGTFITGTLYQISSDGTFPVTFASGALPPIAIGLNTTTAYVDMTGRTRADGVTVKYNSSGQLTTIRGDFKESVRVATTVAGTLATDFENGDTVDGVVLVTGNRILIKNQVAGVENGIYTVNASGAPTRANDYLSGSSAASTVIPVEEGTVNADKTFQCTNNVSSDVVGTDALVFSAFNGEANTASNVGAGGIGVFKQKTGVDLEFRNINAASGKVTVVLDAPNNEVDIDAVPDEAEFILASQVFNRR